MERTVKSHHREEEEDAEEFVSRTSDSSSQKVKVDGKRSDQKASALRSKHSETEQRRRSKINERFQILRDLIPQNDQKRDKASFLLEVIHYIQFLHERLQMYEGTCPGWSPEPSKLMSWTDNCGPVESFTEQLELVKNDSGHESHEDNIVTTPTLLADTNLTESDLNGAAFYKTTDEPPVPATQADSFNVPLQSDLFERVSAQNPQGSASDGEHLTSQSESQFWQGRPDSAECTIPSYALNEQGELKVESGEASISSAYSQGLLNTLTHALQSSGVDLSQASISVQLDVRKRTSGGLTAVTLSRKDHESLSPGNQAMAHYGVRSSGEESDQVYKRLRTETS